MFMKNKNKVSWHATCSNQPVRFSPDLKANAFPAFAFRRHGAPKPAAPFYWPMLSGSPHPARPRVRSRWWLAILACCAGAAALPATAASSFADAAGEVQARTLSNGLQVIVWPDHRIPSVTFYNWVHVGSRNEAAGATGLAHFFEHMMFNGTASHPPGEFERIMTGSGGGDNAHTMRDATVFQDWFPRTALETVLQLESDRLAHLAFVPAVVENERKVVYSERRLRVDDRNPALLAEQVQATAFMAHPYRIPVIGWPSDILSWTIDDLQNFYHTYYVPNNCTLVIVGDVEPEALFALVEKYYGPIPRGAVPPQIHTVEPEQMGERRLQLVRAAQNPLVQVSYHAVAAADARQPALDLLQTILTGGDAAWLYKALVEQRQLAVEIDSGWDEGFDPDLYDFFATLPSGGSAAEFEQALTDQLAGLLRDGVTEVQLARAKNQVEASFWRGVSTIDGRAELLGQYAVLHGDYHLLFTAPAAFESVTAAQVLAVARDVFKPLQRTTGELVPAPPSASGEH
jgi:zinc protease